VGVLTLEVGAVVSGRVVDVAGKPVAGVRVTRTNDTDSVAQGGFGFAFPGSEMMDLARNTDSSLSDEAGRFELAHVAAGEFALRGRHNDYPSTVLSGLSVAQGRSLTVVLISMPRGACIRGLVSDLPADVSTLRVMATKKRERRNDSTGGLMGLIG